MTQPHPGRRLSFASRQEHLEGAVTRGTCVAVLVPDPDGGVYAASESPEAGVSVALVETSETVKVCFVGVDDVEVG